MDQEFQIDRYDRYDTVESSSGKSYIVTYCSDSKVTNSRIQVIEVEEGILGFKKKKCQAYITMLNNKDSGMTSDRSLLKSALENKSYTGLMPTFLVSNRRIADLISQCLSIGDAITIDLLQNFDNASWDTKAKAIIALYNFSEDYKKKEFQPKDSIDDELLEQKIQSLETYKDFSKDHTYQLDK